MGGGYVKPNVSLCDDNGNVYYNLNNNGHEYVDLGLPSGTLWATMNVGASKASDTGLYFQWGDTSGYTEAQIGTGSGQKKFASNWSDYKWYDTNKKAFTKYTTTGATLDLEDDAAHVNMGGSWHMPTPTQIWELLDNTASNWITQDGVKGRLFTSKTDNSKSIFIPASGHASNGSLGSSGSYGYVWCSTLEANSVSYGRYYGFVSSYISLGGYINRSRGFSVRGVLG